MHPQSVAFGQKGLDPVHGFIAQGSLRGRRKSLYQQILGRIGKIDRLGRA
jgi:hypothetical protein